jgi:hypothetical protein
VKTLAIVWTITLVGCATAPVRVPRPIPHVPGKPLQLDILGYRYTVPERLNVQDHNRQAGMFVIAMQDTINRCRVELAFITTTQQEKVDRAFNDAADTAMEHSRRAGLTVDERTGTRKIWNRQATIRTQYLTQREDQAALAYVGLYVPERQLGIQGHIFCDDPGFVEPATKLQFAFLETSRSLSAPAAPAAPTAPAPTSQPVASQAAQMR